MTLWKSSLIYARTVKEELFIVSLYVVELYTMYVGRVVKDNMECLPPVIVEYETRRLNHCRWCTIGFG